MGALAAVFDPRIKQFTALAGQPPTYEAYREYIEADKLFTRQDYKKAIEHYSKAVNIDPTFKHAQFYSVQAHINLGKLNEANAIVKELSKIRETLSPHDQWWLDMYQARFRGDNLGLLKAIRQLAVLTQSQIWHHDLALYAMRCNYPREAIEAIKKVDPEQEDMIGWWIYWNVYTKPLHMLGKHKQELKIARLGRKQYPELISTLWYEVRALAALGRTGEMNKLVDESLVLPPQEGWDPARLMRHAAHELRVHGYTDASLELAERAISWYLAHKDKDYRSGLARAFYVAERWEESLALYEELHKEFPNSIEYLRHLGTSAARMGDREEALKISEQLKNIERPYLFGNTTHNRARIHALLDEKELAMRFLREALSQGRSYDRLHPDMDLDSLWDYPPFQELIKPKG
jgi:tetratricopeptide (TPR) repeat protein